MCTPTHLKALVVGFLFNESIINSLEEVTNTRVCESNDNVDVWLTKSASEPTSWRRTSGCAGGITSVEGIERPNFNAASYELEPVVTQFDTLIESLFQSRALYREVGGIHTSILSDGDQVIFSIKDIGRHNTLDKIADLCLL